MCVCVFKIKLSGGTYGNPEQEEIWIKSHMVRSQQHALYSKSKHDIMHLEFYFFT